MQSIGNALPQLTALASDTNSNIIGITEHWKCDEEIKAYVIPGYELISYFCRNKGQHGGCALYCSSNFQAKENTDFRNLSVAREFECCALNLYVANKLEVIVLTIYRPPLGNINNFFQILNIILDKLLIFKSNFIIAGDFNCDFLKASSERNTLVNLLHTHNVEFTIRDHTKIAGKSKTCLDNINFSYTKAEVINAHISDHFAQKIIFPIKKKTKLQNKNKTN